MADASLTAVWDPVGKTYTLAAVNCTAAAQFFGSNVAFGITLDTPLPSRAGSTVTVTATKDGASLGSKYFWLSNGLLLVKTTNSPAFADNITIEVFAPPPPPP